MKKYIWLYISCIVGIIVFLQAGFKFNNQLYALKKSEDLTSHTYQVINQLLLIDNMMTKAETGQRGFLLTKDSFYLKPYFAARDNIYKSLDSLRDLVKDNQSQVNNITLLKATVAIRFQYLFETLEKKRLDDNNGILEKLALGKNARQNYRQAMENARNVEIALLAKRKTEKQAHEKLTPATFRLIFIASGILIIITMLAMINEMRRRLRYQKELEQKIAELNISNDELEQYAFVASHSLQEPLRKIRTFGTLLLHKQKGTLDEAENHIIGRMEAATAKMQELLDDLVFFTNLVQKKNVLAPLHLKELVTATIHKMQSEHEGLTGIAVGELPVVMGSKEDLEIIFTQLFNNSIKFKSPERQMAISITLETEKKPIAKYKDYYKISFEDNGVGFENAYKNKMFQLFQKLNNSPTLGGKGIGLTICKKIMLNHHGFIDAEGAIGKGSAVYLFFPKP
ncbi:sensor histidine kinase [Parasediminibacterium sp. JCM 36343]|uniref:sensor histidine kinase n=1 Tax=Parasediminibacterium sp. JCM 36343 TaxID=3374279 RepID=UPI0039797B4F